MAQSTFPLSLICDVSVSEANVPVSGPSFNQGLVLGSSGVIPSYGSNPRAREYSSASALLTDGFSTSDPEYIAAQIYFSQVPAPQNLWIGCLDLTAIQSATPHAGTAGTGYVVGDIVAVVQTNASFGQLRVTTIGTNGAVTGLATIQGAQGTGYSVATDLTATGGTGTGLGVDITAVGETPLQAIIACRTASPSWWCFSYPQGVKADHISLATWASQTDQQSYYIFATADADALAGSTGNVFSTIKAESLSRNFGVYTTSQSGLFVNNPYAAAAIMGQLMGLNTGLANSAFSLYYKELAGITTEPINQTNLNTLTNENGNAYISIQNAFETLWPGDGGDGSTPDEQLFIDMLVSAIQYGIANVFTAYPKIPQDNAGQKLLMQAAQIQCANMVTIGFIGPGVWNGESILALNSGDSLPLGYRVQSPLFSTQSPSDRAAHKMMPIYISIIESGSGRSIAVQINVQR